MCLNRPSGSGGAVQGGGAAGAAAGGTEDLLPQAATQHAPHVPQGPHEDHWPAQHQRQRSEFTDESRGRHRLWGSSCITYNLDNNHYNFLNTDLFLFEEKLKEVYVTFDKIFDNYWRIITFFNLKKKTKLISDFKKKVHLSSFQHTHWFYFHSPM